MYNILPNFKNLKIKGYTLIELLVVITIIALLFTVSTASFRGYQKRQNFEAVVRNVQADLRLAQGLALSGKIIDPLCTGNLQGYEFEGNGAHTEYTIKQICMGNKTEHKKVNVNPSTDSGGVFVEVRGSPGLSKFVFKNLGRGIDTTINFGCVIVSQVGVTSRYFRVDRVTGNISVVGACS